MVMEYDSIISDKLKNKSYETLHTRQRYWEIKFNVHDKL